MLSVFTLWIVFVCNSLTLGGVWVYVARSYPSFTAARFWAAASFIGAAGAAVSLLRDVIAPMPPLLVAGTLLIASCSLITMGVERFYERAVSWRTHAFIVAASFVALFYFLLLSDYAPIRIVVYSFCQSIPVAMALTLVLGHHNTERHPGARFAAAIAILVIAINVFRSVTSLFQIGGGVSMLHFSALQTGIVLVMVSLSLAWNFGFLLMAVDRLRAEVADLALLDDLTGVANRRQLLVRLEEECARSARTMQPFALLMIDLDGFKAINDSLGHGAGDECLRLFTRAAQARLRSTDLLARMGGDEFCAVLPATTLREGALVARHLLEACREEAARWEGLSVALSASIGVTQWRLETGCRPEQLIAEADRALYAAKKDGKNAHATFEVTEEADAPPLRCSA